MKLIKIAVVGALLLSGASVLAQGRGGGMMGGMFGGRMAQMDGFLLMSPDVQKDLKITADQKTKIDLAGEAMRAAMPGFGGGRGGGNRGGGGQPPVAPPAGGPPAGGMNFDPAAIQEAMKKQNDALLAILDDTQKARIKQIGIQVAGANALMREDIQKDLDLKAAQKASLLDLQNKQQEATMQLFQAMRNQEMTREEMQEAMAKNNDILKVEALKVLTEEQKKKFEAMQGPKFEGQANMFGMGRGGGRGPGGGQGGGQRPPAGGGAGARPPLA